LRRKGVRVGERRKVQVKSNKIEAKQCRLRFGGWVFAAS
jgi:hypothetical protein